MSASCLASRTWVPVYSNGPSEAKWEAGVNGSAKFVQWKNKVNGFVKFAKVKHFCFLFLKEHSQDHINFKPYKIIFHPCPDLGTCPLPLPPLAEHEAKWLAYWPQKPEGRGGKCGTQRTDPGGRRKEPGRKNIMKSSPFTPTPSTPEKGLQSTDE